MPSKPLAETEKPALSKHVRLTYDRVRERHVLMGPEAVTVLNASGAAILALCDGNRTVREIVGELGARYRSVPDDEVRGFLARMAARHLVEVAGD